MQDKSCLSRTAVKATRLHAAAAKQPATGQESVQRRNRKKEKEKITLFSDQNKSLLRQQPGASEQESVQDKQRMYHGRRGQDHQSLPHSSITILTITIIRIFTIIALIHL